MRRRDGLLAIGVILLVLAALAAKSMFLSVPPVQHQAGEFDATRAKARLAFVLGDQRPHPVDSAADDAVRARLVATLRQMGLQPIIRDQTACNDFQKARLVACARVRNVIATIGPDIGKALLLSAHYDSVPVGPGASDDGVGVATLLEVGSILKDRPLRRPVILLFNEGEELGLLGARAFLADPLSRRVDSVLNFEARGVTGPATMFETSRPNRAAIEAFSKAVARPYASSLSTDVYHLLPNDTDVTTYNERGWLTLNFAMAGNETRYHSPGDDLAGLDPRSLQHMGDQALSVSSELASGLPKAGGERIFMDLVGRTLVQMPLAIGLVVFVLLLLAFAALVWRRRAYGRALAAPFLGIVAGSVAGWLASVAMGLLREGAYWRAHPELSFIAIYATVLLGALAVLRSFGAAATRDQLRAGTWLVFLLAGALLAAAAPGAIIYFLAPPIALLIGIAVSKWWRPADSVGALIAVALLFVTWGEMLALLEVLFSPGPLWIAGPVAAIMMMPALVEAQDIFRRAGRPLTVAASAAVALVAWIVVAAAPAYSQQRQQRFTIEHVTQFPSRRSSWSVLNDGAPLPASYAQIGHWREGKLGYSDVERWLAQAPGDTQVQPPALEAVDSTVNGEERRMTLRLSSRGWDRVILISPPKAHIRAAGIGDFVRPIGTDDSGGKFTIVCAGRSCDGAALRLDLLDSKPVELMAIGSRNGLPSTAAPLLSARPAFARPQYTPNETVAFSSVKL